MREMGVVEGKRRIGRGGARGRRRRGQGRRPGSGEANNLQGRRRRGSRGRHWLKQSMARVTSDESSGVVRGCEVKGEEVAVEEVSVEAFPHHFTRQLSLDRRIEFHS